MGHGPPARRAGRAAPGCARTAAPTSRSRTQCRCRLVRGAARTRPRRRARRGLPEGRRPRGPRRTRSPAPPRARTWSTLVSSRSTFTCAISGPSLPGSTTADAIASSTTIAPSRPDRASARAATRSAASTVSSSKDRTRARPHQVELRATAPRTRVRRASTIGSGMGGPERHEVAQLLVAQLGQRHLAASRAPTRRGCACAASSWPMRCSMVPSVTSRCTCTGRVWPIR